MAHARYRFIAVAGLVGLTLMGVAPVAQSATTSAVAASAASPRAASVKSAVTNAVPFGFIDSFSTTQTSISVAGWALDLDTNDPIAVHIYVDGVGHALTADVSRPDVAAAYGRGDRHGFATTIAVGEGNHSVCTYAINTPAGVNPVIDCRTVAAANAVPFGFVDWASAAGTGISVAGWAIDPDTNDPIGVHVYVDGVGHALTADVSRPDVAAAFGRGDRHGFATTIAVGEGNHSVCIYAINTPAGINPGLRCTTVTVTNAVPFGFIDSISTTYNQLSVAGWALDPDTNDPISVHIYVDGNLFPLTAASSRTDVAAIFGHGDRHGFATTIAVGPTDHTVCVYAINTPAGINPVLGCRTVGSVIVGIAARYVGVPYVWGGSTPAGFDCSGFTSYVYAQVGVHLPRTSADQHYAGTVVPRSQALPGDLIWSPGHIAIFAGGNQLIDATPGNVVRFHAIYQTSPEFIRIG